MSKADKMFEELGYVKTIIHYPHYLDYSIEYYNKEDDMTFIFRLDREWFYVDSRSFNKKHIPNKLIPIIHEKMKELGWLDD